MSRQLYFVQSEEDIRNFLHYIYDIDYMLLYKYGYLDDICSATKLLIDNINSFESQYHILPKSLSYTERDLEYTATVRGNSLSRVYEIGRIYLCRDTFGQYNPDALQCYAQLQRYIKKNYTYHKENQLYVGPEFEKMREKKHWYCAQSGRNIQL